MNLRRLAKGRECMVRLPGICTDERDTVVLAHYRMLGVSGIGLKSPDAIASWACAACHSFVDANKDAETRVAFLHGVLRTQVVLIKGVITW